MKRLTRYSLLVILFMGSIELAVRIDDWITFNAPILENFNHESLLEPDTFGMRGKPNAQYLKWKLNSLGFRGPELRSSRLRIGTVGSSETFGLYESIDHEWPRELERNLNSSPGSAPIEVVNFALAGMLISTFEKRLPEIIRLTSPQVVIIYPSPLGELYRPVKRPEQTKANVKIHAAQTPELRIGYRAQTIFKNNAPHIIVDWLREQMASRIFANTSVVMDRAPDSVLENFRKDIKKVIFDLRAYGIVPVLVTHATYFGARLDSNESSMMIAWRKFYPFLKEEGFLDLEDRANAVLKEIALSEHITIIDAAAKMPEGEEYFADFVHFTDRGSQFFSELIAKHLLCLKQQSIDCLAGN